MAKQNEKPTAEKADTNGGVHKAFGRRKLLQIGGVGLTVGALAAAGVSAESDDLPNTIVFDGTVSPENATYEFRATGAVSGHPNIGTNESGEYLTDGHVTGEIGDEIHAYQFEGTPSSLDVDGAIEITIQYGDRDTSGTDRLEIVASSDGAVEYEITSPEAVSKVLDNEDRSANPGEDTVTETDDGTWVVDGATENGYGDTYDFHGDVERFDPITGDFTLFFNGQETTVSELTGQEAPEEENTEETPDRENWYSIEATGDEYVDYYFEVQDGGDLIASTVDGAVIENDHWINDDGTKAAGRIQPGDTHAYAFDTNVADVTIEGEAHATVNGADSSLDYYPRPEATGDHWKGYFPWQIEGEERTHWYSFEATGDEYVDYYFEVEDGGALIPSAVDDAVIDYEYFWIGDNGTKAAGRVFPGETHAYAFDTLVADVTIEGEADATVNGRKSSLHIYPQDSATGDGWKSGFPWQNDDEGVTESEDSGNGVIGGGSGYENTVTQSDADVVVRSRSELSSALSSASAGDLIFIPGDESIDLASSQFHVPDGVTVASDRGVDGSSGAFLYTDREESNWFFLDGSARLTGIQLRGPHPGDDWGGSSYAVGVSIRGDSEVDNCDIWGFSYCGVRTDQGDGAHIHHNVLRENNTSGLGYGVSASSGTPVIEYNYFNYNRHSVATTGENPGYILRYNHFGPTEVMHNIDAHSPAGDRYEIHNNVVETIRREWDDNVNRIVYIRDVPDDMATIRDNWFFNDNAPDPDGSPKEKGQTIVQGEVSTWTNMEFYDNYYGEDANVTYSDIIPGYDGWRS